MNGFFDGLFTIFLSPVKSEKLAFCRTIASMRDGEQIEGEIGDNMIRELKSILERGEPVEARKSTLKSSPPSSEPQSAEGNVSQTSAKSGQDPNGMIDLKPDTNSNKPDETTSRSSLWMPLATANEPQILAQATTRAPGSVDESTANPQSDQTERSSNDAWLRFGMATLGVLVGGMLVSRNEEGDEQQRQEHGTSHSAEMGASTRNSGSTVQIEELHDEAEEEWVSVPQ